MPRKVSATKMVARVTTVVRRGSLREAFCKTVSGKHMIVLILLRTAHISLFRQRFWHKRWQIFTAEQRKWDRSAIENDSRSPRKNGREDCKGWRKQQKSRVDRPRANVIGFGTFYDAGENDCTPKKSLHRKAFRQFSNVHHLVIHVIRFKLSFRE